MLADNAYNKAKDVMISQSLPLTDVQTIYGVADNFAQGLTGL